MGTILVSLPCGAGVVRDDDGSISVTDDVTEGYGTGLRDEDLYDPVQSWLDEDRSVVGGRLPPGAVRAEVIDDRGNRVQATVENGCYAAVVPQPNDGYGPIVCCRDADNAPVRRPWAADYPSVRVTDADEPCPACGAIDYDEYTPFEQWRSGRCNPDGTVAPSPVVSCRVCGHEEREPVFLPVGSRDDGEDGTTKAERLARAHAEWARRSWLRNAEALRTVNFPVYGADGWHAVMGGHGSDSDGTVKVTVNHFPSTDARPANGDQSTVRVVTIRGLDGAGDIFDLRTTLEHWHRPDAGRKDSWEGSHAAITLRQRARDREHRAAVLDARRSTVTLLIDGTATPALMLTAADGRWVAGAGYGNLTITVAAVDLDPASLELKAFTDLKAQLLGPEPAEL